ncbi:serine hydrolase domain-containing protein [Actinoplanes sp. TBRC 11911]|uniref:serine hydrolase domain-containing protein n=1 Tax=Actinoplanes sp. TBRC 11911 TaxID=2729386 RepID=UPI00289FB1F3|nr:serine hydrolase domain-containing protein [Actinoplanes sp. TBRC 11911]
MPETLALSLERGADAGASVAVYLDGQPVVDIWGGYLDPRHGRHWERDTITNVWSTTKTMTALCALVLADRGELDLYAPVATYWPEFAAAGKAGIEVRHLLSHTAGLWTWDEPLSVSDLYDWDKVTGLLARQAPAWEPGTQSGYHSLTFGYLVGEVVRRITGDTLGSFFAKELAGPLGADFHIGLSAEHDHRVASNIRVVDGEVPLNPLVKVEDSWTPQWRRAEIPAANGHGNARSVAAIQSVLAGHGEARGVRILSEAGAARVLEEQSYGPDKRIGAVLRFGMGYALSSPEMPLSPNARSCYWGGFGGSLVVVDLDARVTVAYVGNRMLQDTFNGRGAAVVRAVYAALAQ